jgi:hypothetical protein
MSDESQRLVVFISFSGERSEQLGNWLVSWIQKLLPEVTVYFSNQYPSAGGGPYIDHIHDYMSEASMAVFCVTAENMNSNWINYELGLASASPKSKSGIRILTIGVKPSDLSKPASLYYAAQFSNAEIEQLLTLMAERSNYDVTSFKRTFKSKWRRMESEAQRFL